MSSTQIEHAVNFSRVSVNLRQTPSKVLYSSWVKAGVNIWQRLQKSRQTFRFDCRCGIFSLSRFWLNLDLDLDQRKLSQKPEPNVFRLREYIFKKLEVCVKSTKKTSLPKCGYIRFDVSPFSHNEVSCKMVALCLSPNIVHHWTPSTLSSIKTATKYASGNSTPKGFENPKSQSTRSNKIQSILTPQHLNHHPQHHATTRACEAPWRGAPISFLASPASRTYTSFPNRRLRDDGAPQLFLRWTRNGTQLSPSSFGARAYVCAAHRRYNLNFDRATRRCASRIMMIIYRQCGRLERFNFRS